MKYELNEEQVILILDALDALSDAAEAESKATSDPEIRESNDATMKAAKDLYEYIANYKPEE